MKRLCLIFFLLGLFYGYHIGVKRGTTIGRDRIIKEAISEGAASLYCNSETMDVEVLWVTNSEDRKKIQKLMKEGIETEQK